MKLRQWNESPQKEEKYVENVKKFKEFTKKLWSLKPPGVFLHLGDFTFSNIM